MNEMRYQIDLINAMNEKLKNEQKMMGMIIETSTSAFAYYNFARDELRILGEWDAYFPIRIRKINEMQRIAELVDERFREDFIKCINADRRGDTKTVATVMIADTRRWVETEVSVVYDEMRKPVDKVIRFRDVTRINTQNEELKYMAYYDIVTGLYNRNYFIQRLGEFISKAEIESKKVSVMFVDIDDFRRINDGMGLVVGDELMLNFGQFLAEFSNENCIVSHFNGDLYCIAVYDPVGTNNIENIYMSIRRRTRHPFLTSDGREIYIKVTAGVAEYPDASKNVLELINCAEIVMLRAKHGGKDSFQYFDSEILEEFLHNVTIDNKLRSAVFDMNFLMYFQPQYELKTNKLRGVEALIRWQDRDEGMISPAEFIPLAEKNGTIVPIGQWVVEDSIRTFMEWRRTYDKPLVLSVNISAVQYKRDDFVDKLLEVINKYHMKPEELELEITESVFIENYELIIKKLRLLREYGIKISMDDFGTGYSSLSYLMNLPIDTLKIDKSFVDSVLEDDNSAIIMESIMNMVKKMGLETVAEGVETVEQLEYLKSIGCDNIQGFLLGKPQPDEGIRELISEQV